MAYNGTTKVLSGLIPANGTAPVADAKDIYVNDSTRLNQKLSDMDDAIGAGSNNKLNSAAVAPTYSDSSPYSVGQLVTHDGGFYRCNTAISSSGEEWNPAHWDAVTADTVFITSTDAQSNFVQKETGKGLSSNDFTTEEKTKLAGIAAGATAVTVDSALTQGGTNPVQGGVIYSRFATVQSMVGSPLVAATAADMTDTTKVYVYTGSETGYTNGDWYYYDGSAWADGGVYNSTAFTTDTTLAVSGQAADAKATGDAIAAMSGATGAESGKALLADTVSNGKVTRWKFGDTSTDTTLSVSGKAADAKVVGDEVGGLKSALNNTENTLFDLTGKLTADATVATQWTETKIFDAHLKANHTYTVKFYIISSVEYTIYFYLKKLDGTELISAQLNSGSTSIIRQYTPISDVDTYTCFQIGVNTSTTVYVEMIDADSIIGDINTNISEIQDEISVINEGAQQNVLSDIVLSAVQKVSNVTNKKVFYNQTYNRIATTPGTGLGIDVYPVTKGIYKVTGYGINGEAQPIAVLGDADIINSGASYCNLLQTFDFGASSTIEWITGTINVEHDGYLYVNYATYGESGVQRATETVSKAVITSGIIKDGQTYTYIQSLPKGNYIARKFRQTGPNNLLDFAGLYFGSLSGPTFVPDKTIFESYTDNIGPYSIGRSIADGGSWAGGYHAVNVGGVNCPTSKQESLAVFVNGVDISNSADGFYAGNAIIEAINSIYFPQTITDNVFTNAVKAIEETRRFILKDTLEVEVITKTVASVYVSMYYGMQMQTAWATNFIIPSEEALYAKADIPSDILFMTKGHKLEALSDDAFVQMLLDNDGIGTYKYNNGERQYGHIMSNGAKLYFALIYNTTFESGKYLYWSGKYNAFQR